jgi:hypothetical protein
MPDFPDDLGIISFGDGAVVLPGPDIQPEWNLLVRDYEDNVFRWKQVVGLEPSPDEGYQLAQATHYRLEITPDLGWPNVEAMFEPWIDSEVGLGNARLIVLDRLHYIEDLHQVGDETVEYSVSTDTMKKVIAPNFRRYLWRVRAISSTGAVGDPSSIQVFRGRVIIPQTDWSVDPLPEVSHSLAVVITGTKSPAITEIELNGVQGLVSFPSGTTWQAEVILAAGRNVFDVRAIDAQGNTSEYRRVETKVTSEELDTFAYFNRFDDFGFMLDLPRIKGESNYNYRERIKDVMVHRADSRYPGLMNGILRELDLEYEDEAMYIAAGTDPDSQDLFPDITCWLDTEGFHISSPRYVRHQEYKLPDPHTAQFRLDDLLPFGEVRLEQPLGKPIHDRHFSIDGDGLVTLAAQYAHSPVYATYTYILSTPVVSKTVAELVDDVNDLAFEGNQQVIASVNEDFDSDELASGLQRFRPTRIGTGVYTTLGEVEVEDRYPIRWAEIELYPIMDKGFKDRHSNEWGSRFGTRYDAWAMGLKQQLHTTWGYLVADENVWSHPEIRVSGIGTLETIYDAPKGYWTAALGGAKYPTRWATFLGYEHPADGSILGYIGVPWAWIKSGIGDGNDLYVTLTETAGDIEQEAEEELTIVQTAVNADPDDVDLGLGDVAVDSADEVS